MDVGHTVDHDVSLHRLQAKTGHSAIGQMAMVWANAGLPYRE